VSYKCQLLRVADHTFLYITIAELVEKKPPSCTMSLYYVATGQMLINWFLSAFPEEHYLRLLLTSQDLRILAAQFCTHLLAAGVLRQIPDKDVTLEPLFRVSKPLHNGEEECSSVCLSILFSDLLNGHVCEIQYLESALMWRMKALSVNQICRLSQLMGAYYVHRRFIYNMFRPKGTIFR